MKSKPTAKTRALARAVKTWALVYGKSEDYRTFTVDLLADLLHFCRANGVDFEDAYLMAERHCSEEASHE